MTKPFHKLLLEHLDISMQDLFLRPSSIRSDANAHLLIDLLRSTEIPASAVVATVQTLEGFLQNSSPRMESECGAVIERLRRFIIELKEQPTLPLVTTESIGEKGIVQVGDTADTEDSGILRL